MISRRSRRPLRIAAFLVAPVLALLVALPASAADFSTGASIVASGCTSQSSPLGYAGGYAYTGVFPSSWAKGTVYVCYTKQRLADSDPNGDYYAMTVTSNWTYSSGGRNYPARTYQYVASNTVSKDNVYGAPGTMTSSTGCNTAFSVSWGLGPFTARVTPAFCSGYTVSRSAYTAQRANYTSSTAGELTKVETTYSQKVANGTVPRFEAHVAVPRYSHYWNGSQWQTTEQFYWVDWYNI